MFFIMYMSLTSDIRGEGQATNTNTLHNLGEPERAPHLHDCIVHVRVYVCLSVCGHIPKILNEHIEILILRRSSSMCDACAA